MKAFSPEHHILKYLAKWEQNKNDPLWLANKYVQSVLTDGELDIVKVRNLFQEREICDGATFDLAVEQLKTINYLKEIDGKVEADVAGIAKHLEIAVALKQDVADVDSKKITEGELKNKEY